MAKLTITAARMVDRIEEYMRWTSPTGPQSAQALEWLNDGYREFMFGRHPETRVIHTWSFLDPSGTIDLVDGTQTYDLPADFDSMINLSYQGVSGVAFPELKEISNQDFNELAMLHKDSAESEPEFFTIIPKTFVAGTGQQYQVKFLLIPDESRTVDVQYAMRADALTDAAIFHMGSPQYAECILEAGLSKAEKQRNNFRGFHFQEFQRLLTECIEHDKIAVNTQVRRENMIYRVRATI